MDYYESRLAAVLISVLETFLQDHDLGIVLGADATLRLMPGLVRLPDVSFIAWKKFPGRLLPAEPVPDLVPDLAVEILSEGNTEQEMKRKVREYFQAGTRLVWLVDPEARAVTVYTSPKRSSHLAEDQTLTGSRVLPGLAFSIQEWFTRAGQKRPE